MEAAPSSQVGVGGACDVCVKVAQTEDLMAEPIRSQRSKINKWSHLKQLQRYGQRKLNTMLTTNKQEKGFLPSSSSVTLRCAGPNFYLSCLNWLYW